LFSILDVKKEGVEANMLKLMASENANQAADLGIQIMGGMGYSAETDMQRYWRDSRLWRIGPITNEMVRNGIAESLGLPVAMKINSPEIFHKSDVSGVRLNIREPRSVRTAFREMMEAVAIQVPGAVMSGLIRPSSAGPRLEKSAMVSAPSA
jgi:hypothetical protein